MAVKIPQNIEREDKLVGPLTLKQFLYVLGGAGLIFVAYQAYTQGYLFAHEFFIIAFLSGGLAVALAFVKINGRPFMIFIGNVFAYWFSKKTHLWQKQDKMNAPADIRIERTTESVPAKTDEIQKSELEKLATVLDTSGKIKTESGFVNTHEISTLPPTNAATPEIIEDKLGVEDIFEDTDV